MDVGSMKIIRINESDAQVIKTVPLGVYQQVCWERDIAIKQLNAIGKSFGETMDDVMEILKKYRTNDNDTHILSKDEMWEKAAHKGCISREELGIKGE